jgi:AraC-like DNA-binding protein
MSQSTYDNTPDNTHVDYYFDMLKMMLAEAGISLDVIMKKLGYAADTPWQSFSAVDYLKIMSLGAIELKDESLFLTNRRLLPGTNDFVLKNLRDAKSPIAVLQTIANSYNIIHGGRYNRVEVSKRYVSYIIDDTDFPYSQTSNAEYIAFSLESALVFIHGAMSFLLPGCVAGKVAKVDTKAHTYSLLASTFSHAQVSYSEKRYTLYYDISLLDLRVTMQPESDLNAIHVYQQLQQNLIEYQQPSIILEVRRLFEMGVRQQDKVAQHLNFSVAVLKRKLNAHRTNFRYLKETSLNQQGQRLMLQGITIADTAESLGFSDERSFCRAFKKWNSLTPAAFINKMSKDIVSCTNQ